MTFNVTPCNTKNFKKYLLVLFYTECGSASLNHIVFTVMDVKDKLEVLDANKSIGLDKVHPRVLKECSQSMSYPLMLIFNKSLGTGELPSFWKMANVTPIHKKGIKTDPNNYRPVSLTSVVCKVIWQNDATFG